MAVVAGLPGLALLAVPQLTGPHSAFASHGSVAPNRLDSKADNKDPKGQPPDANKAADGADKKSADAGKKEGTDKVETLPCDPNALIVGILKANADGRGELRLADHCTYTLTAFQSGNGLPPVTVPLAIDGNHSTIVRAANLPDFRIFDVATGGNLILRDIAVTGGQDSLGSGGGGMLIETGGTATLMDTKFTDNRTSQSGGAIRSSGSLTVKRSTFTDNIATLFDGGAIASDGPLLTIEDSTIERNVAKRWGGGISTNATAFNLTKTIVTDNQATTGGGLFLNGPSTLVRSTVAENHAADQGGGIFISTTGPVTIRDSLIKENFAISGAGITSNTQTTVENTKILGNFASDTDAGILAFSVLVLRHSEVKGNRAANAIGGIGAAATANVSLFDSVVSENSAAKNSGGAGRAAGSTFTLDPHSVIINNRPTNCVGSNAPITGCFG